MNSIIIVAVIIIVVIVVVVLVIVLTQQPSPPSQRTTVDVPRIAVVIPEPVVEPVVAPVVAPVVVATSFPTPWTCTAITSVGDMVASRAAAGNKIECIGTPEYCLWTKDIGTCNKYIAEASNHSVYSQDYVEPSLVTPNRDWPFLTYLRAGLVTSDTLGYETCISSSGVSGCPTDYGKTLTSKNKKFVLFWDTDNFLKIKNETNVIIWTAPKTSNILKVQGDGKFVMYGLDSGGGGHVFGYDTSAGSAILSDTGVLSYIVNGVSLFSSA